MKALVTGASSGIGREIARELARRGYDLILTARRADRLRELAAELPVAVEVLPADLTDRAQVTDLWERVKDQDIDILVNNAGRGLFGPFDETDLDTELEMLEVNIVALHTLTKRFLPKLKARGTGRILNVASSAAFLPGPLLSSYYASKAYVLRLSEAVAEELRPIREEYERLMADKGYLESCYREGAEKARAISQRTLDKVYKKIGFLPAAK